MVRRMTMRMRMGYSKLGARKVERRRCWVCEEMGEKLEGRALHCHLKVSLPLLVFSNVTTTLLYLAWEEKTLSSCGSQGYLTINFNLTK